MGSSHCFSALKRFSGWSREIERGDVPRVGGLNGPRREGLHLRRFPLLIKAVAARMLDRATCGVQKKLKHNTHPGASHQRQEPSTPSRRISQAETSLKAIGVNETIWRRNGQVF